MSNKILIATQNLQSKLADLAFPQGYTVEYHRVHPGRSSLDEVENVAPSGGGEYEYNGPFKLVLDGDRVYIVDGATYKNANDLGDDMLVYVNQSKFYVSPFTSEPKTDDATFALRFTSPTDEQGKDSGQDPKVEFVDLSIEHNNELPDDTARHVWHRIGRLLVEELEDGSREYKIAQDHMSGDISLRWYMPCWGGEV